MQLENKTPFSAKAIILPNLDGVDTLYTVVKATFKIGSKWTLAEEQLPPQAEEEFWGDPSLSSLKYPTDFHVGKQATDIGVVGSAHSLDAIPVKSLDVGVAVGPVQKTVRVFGDRQWYSGVKSAPLEFSSMPLVYERAYGGRQIYEDDAVSEEPRNPVGLGFRGKRSNTDMNGEALPNIEDPKQLISTLFDSPEPTCFGFIPAHWLPRAKYAGTYDNVWMQTRAPYLPRDFSIGFNNSAHRDLVCPSFLSGGEPVKIVNMRPEGPMNFNLPVVKLLGKARVVRMRDQSFVFNLETVIIETDLLRLQMTWKAALVLNNNASKVNKIELSLSR